MTADLVVQLQALSGSIRLDASHPDREWLPELLLEAVAEITRLRSLAGAVSDGPSLADIKTARHGVSDA